MHWAEYLLPEAVAVRAVCVSCYDLKDEAEIIVAILNAISVRNAGRVGMATFIWPCTEQAVNIKSLTPSSTEYMYPIRVCIVLCTFLLRKNR